MASELLLATRSSDKLTEIRAILASAARVNFLTLNDLAIPPSVAEDEIESAATFLTNAIAKARHFSQLTGLRTLADDSGISVDALAGAPGVRTRRFAIDRGAFAADAGGKALDEANNTLLLELLTDVSDQDRGAHYVCAAALADSTRVIAAAIGSCRGMIARAPAGSGGFGYDPLFVLPDLAITFAELSPQEKNVRSHRAKAFRALIPQLTAKVVTEVVTEMRDRKS